MVGVALKAQITRHFSWGGPTEMNCSTTWQSETIPFLFMEIEETLQGDYSHYVSNFFKCLCGVTIMFCSCWAVFPVGGPWPCVDPFCSCVTLRLCHDVTSRYLTITSSCHRWASGLPSSTLHGVKVCDCSVIHLRRNSGFFI